MIFKIFSLLALILAVSCQKEVVKDTGVDNISNPMQDKSVYYKGATFDITFKADASWSARLEFRQGDGWAQITRQKGYEAAGNGSIRINCDPNESGEERTVVLWINVQGRQDAAVIEIRQASQPESSAMSEFLNAHMDEILQKDYLWAEQYLALKKDLTVSYDEFLFTHLSQLGETNIEDGGYYRAYSSNSGKRYIYSYIQEVTDPASKAPMTRAGTLPESFGLGIGPLFASPTGQDDNIYLTVGYVYRGSPAELAGLRKGDNIYAIAKGSGNPITITRDNYQMYMKELFSSPSGTYNLMFARYDAPTEDDPGVYPLNRNNAVEITAQTYGYDPILYAAYLKKADITTSENTGNWPDFCIGYLAMESFDLGAQFVLEDQLMQFAQAGFIPPRFVFEFGDIPGAEEILQRLDAMQQEAEGQEVSPTYPQAQRVMTSPEPEMAL
jgi:hypothetical protein